MSDDMRFESTEAIRDYLSDNAACGANAEAIYGLCDLFDEMKAAIVAHAERRHGTATPPVAQPPPDAGPGDGDEPLCQECGHVHAYARGICGDWAPKGDGSGRGYMCTCSCRRIAAPPARMATGPRQARVGTNSPRDVIEAWKHETNECLKDIARLAGERTALAAQLAERALPAPQSPAPEPVTLPATVRDHYDDVTRVDTDNGRVWLYSHAHGDMVAMTFDLPQADALIRALQAARAVAAAGGAR